MSSSTGTNDFLKSRLQKNHCSNWSCFNITAMVLGFILFWPLGLFLLFWIMTGRSIKELPGQLRELWAIVTNWGGFESKVSSDNVIFDEYQQTQYDRIREIKAEIKDRGRRFHQFRDDAKRRADEEEFNRFMSSAP